MSLAGARTDDRHDVEAARALRLPFDVHVDLRRAHEAAALQIDDGLERRAVAGVGARAHLDEDERAGAVEADEIDLAAATGPVAVDDAIAFALEEFGRARLGDSAERARHDGGARATAGAGAGRSAPPAR